MSPLRKVLLSLSLVGSTAAIAGLGAFATFTSSTSVSQGLSAGTVSISLGATGASTNRLNIGASGLVPGDTIQRSVNLTNSSTAELASVKLTTTATTSSVLDTDGSNGLQMVIDECSVAWTESESTPYTYTCSGSTNSVLASRAVIGTDLTLSNLTLNATGTEYLRVTLTFPAASTVGQGASSTISYAFTATQRAGTSK